MLSNITKVRTFFAIIFIILLILLKATNLFFGSAEAKEFNSITISKIEQMLGSGEIDYQTALTYKVYAVFEPNLLPQKFRGKLYGECGTLLLREIINELIDNWDTLSTGTKRLIEPYIKISKLPIGRIKVKIDEPTLDYSYIYGNFVFEYTLTGPHSVNPTDSDNDSVPDYVETLADRFQNKVWSFVIGTLSYTPPPTPYIVKIYDVMGKHGWNGYCVADIITGNIATSHIGIDNDLPLEKVVTDAHEFFHAVQFRYDYNEDKWWMEASATWMSDEVYDIINYYIGYLRRWFNTPDISLNYFSDAEDDPGYLHEYGSCIFCKFLSEHRGGRDIIKEIWERCSEMCANFEFKQEEEFICKKSHETLNYKTPLEVAFEHPYLSKMYSSYTFS